MVLGLTSSAGVISIEAWAFVISSDALRCTSSESSISTGHYASPVNTATNRHSAGSAARETPAIGPICLEPRQCAFTRIAEIAEPRQHCDPQRRPC